MFFIPSPIRRIFRLAAPIIISMWAFNFSGIIETVFIARLGEAELAASGISNFIIYLLCTVAIGLGIGVQTETAHRLGKKAAFLTSPLLAGIIVSLGVTIMFSAAIWIISPWLIHQFSTDAHVLSLAIPFSKLKLMGLWGYSLLFIFRGYWMAIQRPIPAFIILMLTNGLIILFDAIAMFGLFGIPAMGLMGAGIGFSVAAILGGAAFVGWSWLNRHQSGFLERFPKPHDFGNVIRYGTPVGIQESLIGMGLAGFIYLFGQIGTTEQAIGNVLIQLATLLILPAIGFGLATHSLIGESYGKGDFLSLSLWCRRLAIVVGIFSGIVSLCLAISSLPILQLVLPNQKAIQIAHLPFLIDLATIAFFSVGTVYEYALKGMGKMVLSLVISISLYSVIIIPILGMFILAIPLTIFKIWCLFAVFNILYLIAYGGAYHWILLQKKHTSLSER